MLPMGHCQVLPPLCPLRAETVVFGSQQGLPCGSVDTVTTGQKPLLIVFPPALIPYKFLICAAKAWAPMKRSCLTIRDIAWSWQGVVFRGATADFPGSKVPVAACFWRMQLTIAWVRPTRPAIALCTCPHGQVKGLHALYRSWTGQF